MILATSCGAAVTSQTRWPASRCIWTRARVPGQIFSAMTSSKISSQISSRSAVCLPATRPSAVCWASAMWPGSSVPCSRNQACCQANRATSRWVKKLRRYSPTPR